jgi:hypothetical protein
MWPFKKKGDGELAESRMSQMAVALQASFQRVRNDMDNVNAWMNYFHHQDSQRQAEFGEMKSQLAHFSSRIESQHGSHTHPEMDGMASRMKAAEDKIQHALVSVHSVQPVMSKIAELNSKIAIVEQAQKSVFERLKEVSLKAEHASVPRARTATNLREKIAKKIARHSKEYIKNIIISTISKYDQVPALKLREMIVEEQGLCSKSTFYRLLEEIEAEESVSMIARGKEKLYIPKIVKKHHV